MLRGTSRALAMVKKLGSYPSRIFGTRQKTNRLLPYIDMVILPLIVHPAAAGFPSPANDSIEQKLDLNEHLIKNKEASFFMRVRGDSMIGAGIHNDDLLIVDRSLTAHDKSIVVAIVDGGFLVKRLIRHDDKLLLASENPCYEPIEITPDMDFEIWGVVTSVIHKV